MVGVRGRTVTELLTQSSGPQVPTRPRGVVIAIVIGAPLVVRPTVAQGSDTRRTLVIRGVRER
jgi:hypothetical protein